MTIKEQFKAAVEAALPRITAALKRADDALEEAKAISNETGVPFHSYIIDNTSDNYVPSTMLEKFPGVDGTGDDEDETILSEICDIYDYGGYGYSEGWQKSYC